MIKPIVLPKWAAGGNSDDCFEFLPDVNSHNQRNNGQLQLENGSSIGTLGDFFGESHRIGDIENHYASYGGLFNVLPNINLDQSVSMFETDGGLEISTIAEILYTANKHRHYDWCHFSVRVKAPSDALEYIRKKIHNLVGPTKFMQAVLHEEATVNPHIHFIHAGTASPPRTSAMQHFLRYYCQPFTAIIHGRFKFTSAIKCAIRFLLLQQYLVVRY